MAEDTASALFGVEGLRVADAEREADGTLTVWVVTDHPGAAACPDCGAELEVTATGPVALALAPEAEEDWGE